MEDIDPKDSISVFDITVDEKDRLQKLILANVTYIIKDDCVLMMTHTKANSVTDGRHIGVGGKYAMKSFNGYESEKIPTKEIIENIMFGTVSMEDSLKGTCREIQEETSLNITPEQLRIIGFSHIKKKTEKVNELWNIVSYVVDDYKGEINIGKLNKESIEGVFRLIKLKDIPETKMWPADSIIFNNRDKSNNIYVEAIYDESGGGELRGVLNNGEKDDAYSSTYILIPDLLKPTEYIGEELKVEASSLKDCSVINTLANTGTDIEKFVQNTELKIISLLPGIKSTTEKFEFPEHSDLVKINNAPKKDDRAI